MPARVLLFLFAATAGAQDLVLVNGHIITVDANDSVAQAVAITGGKIVAVGTNAAAQKAAAKGARVIDLHGRTATPGLIDSHAHFQEVDALYAINLSDPAISKISDVLDRVRAKVATLKPGEWVRGSGWDEGKLAERRYITAADLDAVAPDNPVYLTHTTGHYGVANSYAMRLAKVTAETKDPPAGTIDRDSQGRPTGVLKESAAGLVNRLVPRYTRDQQMAGLLRIMEDFNREGMTAVKDPAIGFDKFNLYTNLLQSGKLSVRVFALWNAGRTLGAATATLKQAGTYPKPAADTTNGMLIAGGMKLYMDGSGGARTAWMYQDWNKDYRDKDSGNQGYPTTDPAAYRQIVKLFHDAGYHVSTHAIGDRAIDTVVDTYAEVLKDKPTRGLRHGIIHCNTPTDRAIDTMAALQKQYDAGYPEAQAPFLWWLGDNYAGNLGPDRAPRLMPFAKYLKKGMLWTGGSDYPVTPFAARYGLWSSAERRTLNGVYGSQPFGVAESVDIHAALKSYTIWAARQLFLESRIGSLEAGKDADIAIWDRDLYRVPAAELKNLKCEMTLLAGKVVFDASSGAPSNR
jgi:predicted amidohydrolase YtcJ